MAVPIENISRLKAFKKFKMSSSDIQYYCNITQLRETPEVLTTIAIY